jgi:hypothetical protein
MAMKNYEVTQEDGTSTIYQFDDADDVGKQQLAVLHAAAKDKDNPVASIKPGEPTPINAAGKG